MEWIRTIEALTLWIEIEWHCLKYQPISINEQYHNFVQKRTKREQEILRSSKITLLKHRFFLLELDFDEF